MQEMKDYEGTCKYCGATEIIIAVSQEAADEVVTNRCPCNGAAETEKKAKYMQKIRYIATGKFSDVFAELDSYQIEQLKELGNAIIDGVYNKAQVEVADSTIKLWISGDKYKISRKTTCEEEVEA